MANCVSFCMSSKKQVKFDELNVSQHNGIRVKEETKDEVKTEVKKNNIQYCFNIFRLFCYTHKDTQNLETNDAGYSKSRDK